SPVRLVVVAVPGVLGAHDLRVDRPGVGGYNLVDEGRLGGIGGAVDSPGEVEVLLHVFAGFEVHVGQRVRDQHGRAGEPRCLLEGGEAATGGSEQHHPGAADQGPDDPGQVTLEMVDLLRAGVPA